MFLVLWEYEVKPGNALEFENVYGSTGAWAQLFQRDARYLGTQLMRAIARPTYYLTLDARESRTAYEDFKSAHTIDYVEYDKKCDALTASEKFLGTWEQIP